MYTAMRHVHCNVSCTLQCSSKGGDTIVHAYMRDRRSNACLAVHCKRWCCRCVTQAVLLTLQSPEFFGNTHSCQTVTFFPRRQDLHTSSFHVVTGSMTAAGSQNASEVHHEAAVSRCNTVVVIANLAAIPRLQIEAEEPRELGVSCCRNCQHANRGLLQYEGHCRHAKFSKPLQYFTWAMVKHAGQTFSVACLIQPVIYLHPCTLPAVSCYATAQTYSICVCCNVQYKCITAQMLLRGLSCLSCELCKVSSEAS